MKKTLLICVIPFFVACGDTKTDSADTDSQTQELVENLAAEHNATSTFSIEGMTCEIGCVRTVKSRLSKMAGVLEINMDFDTARTTNYSTVNYDGNIISEEEMKAEIESIANGIYAVTDISAKAL